MDKKLENRLKELKIEDNIWILYIGIIIASLYSNALEKKYFVDNNLDAKEKYRKITITIFIVLIFVYGYFLNDSFSSFKDLKESDTKKYKDLTTLSFIGSLLIFVSGLIFFYIALSDENIDVEIAFN